MIICTVLLNAKEVYKSMNLNDIDNNCEYFKTLHLHYDDCCLLKQFILV